MAARLVLVINFRYHLISLMAVFLSLALGIALGATVVEKGVTDVLDRRIDEVSNAKRATDDRNVALLKDNARERDVLKALGPVAVRNHLTSAKVAVLAMRGIDGDAVESTIQLLQAAGADAPAVIWLEPKWILADDGDRADLRAVIGREVADDALAAEGLQLLADRLASPTEVAERDDALISLRSAGFVSIDAKGEAGRSDLSAFPLTGGSVVAFVGLGIGVDIGTHVETFTNTLSEAMSDAELPLVIAERDSSIDIFPERGGALKLLRPSPTVSTVDSLDLVQGQIATVFAIEALRNGESGRFGYGPGARRALPEQ